MKKTITRLSLLLPILLLPLAGSMAQGEAQPNPRLDRLNLETFELPNAEPGNHVQAIVQDHYGFMWFGSQYGLHRWDGNQFKTFLHDPANPQSISGDYIESILVAKDGTLWIGTWGAGLNHFDQKTGKFVRYYHGRHNGLSSNFVNAMVEDRDGVVWIGTQDGLDRLNPLTGEIDHFRHANGDSRSLSCNQVRSLLIDAEGTLWVGTGFFFDDSNNGGLNRYHPESGDFTRYLSNPKDPNSLLGNEIRALYEDTKGNLWVGTNKGGLHLMNTQTGTFKRFQQNGTDINSMSAPHTGRAKNTQVNFIFQDQEDMFWVGNWGGGIKCFDTKSGKAKVFAEGGKKGSDLLENYAWTVFQSKDGVLWFSTASGDARVYRATGKKSIFNSVYLPSKTDFVRSFAEDTSNNIYFSTNQNLVGKLNQRPAYNNTDCVNFHDEDAALAGSNKIVKDVQGRLWGMKESGGLVRYDPKSQTTRQFRHQPENAFSLPAAPVQDILPDKKGNLWLATYGDGLFFFDKKTEKFLPLRQQKATENSLPHQYTGKLFMDAENNLWVTGGGKGMPDKPFFITKFDPSTQNYTRYQLKGVPGDDNFWQSSPLQDKAGNIWACLDYGILKLVPKTGECSFFDIKRLGNKGSTLRGMVMDNDGRFWILSDALLAFDPVKETVFSYGVSSGLKALPFERDAIFKSEAGEIFIGGRCGFHYFDPQLLDNSNVAPPLVRITGFELLDADGPESRFEPSVMQGKPIELAYDEDVFMFSFSILDYNDPSANRLEFMLEGLDKDWRMAGQDLKATYVKVPTGNYRFRVRGANSYGVWGEEISVALAVSPPWWLTWWAWAIYAFLVAGAIYMAYRLLLSRKMEKAETLRLKELDTVKNRLFANITHEFRTPLTIILGMAERGRAQIGALHEADKSGSNLPNSLLSNFELIERNGTNLLGLVNQMLELAKMENGTVGLDMVHGDVVAYLKYVTSNFQALAAEKHLGLHFLSDLDELTMDYDAEKLQRVLSNLLSNALKFTPQDGNIYVSIAQQEHWEQHTSSLLIKVRDTGAGIAPDKLPHVFDRFFQASEGAHGSGIGLALTKEFVKLMGGEITVRSRTGEGTEFVVSLPVKKEFRDSRDAFRGGTQDFEPISSELKNALLEQVNENDLSTPVSPLPTLPFGEKVKGVAADHGKENDLPLLLLIDDNPDVMTYLRSCLAPDYRLLSAQNGQEGTQLAIKHVPDLVVTDVMMPVMDGYEVCRFLKNDERTSHIPVVMLTAKAGFESRMEGLEMGADAYLAKPFHQEELLVRIKNLLEVRLRLQQHYRKVAGINAELFPFKLVKQQTPPVKEAEDYFMKKARRTVEAHLDDYEFNVEQLCKEIGMSHSHLHRKLSALTGCSASRFIRQIRLRKAQELLENPNLTITAVAFDTGFSDPGYFGRVFKQEFNMTPMEWRERMVGVAN